MPGCSAAAGIVYVLLLPAETPTVSGTIASSDSDSDVALGRSTLWSVMVRFVPAVTTMTGPGRPAGSPGVAA